MNRPFLILDLDETLIYATERDLASPPDFRVGPYAVYRRPHLTAFLDFCFAAFDVAVWTSASHSYASEVVGHIFAGRQLRFLWTGHRCTPRFDPETGERYDVKDLRKIEL